MDHQKPKPRHNNMKTNLCLPRFRTNTSSSSCSSNRKNPREMSPAMSLLNRLREAVFRLIMLSALSKAASQQQTRSAGCDRAHSTTSSCYYNPQDPHHSEAVADCIEFIKKSATTDDSNRHSTASSNRSSIDAAAIAEVVFPLPVMSYTCMP